MMEYNKYKKWLNKLLNKLSLNLKIKSFWDTQSMLKVKIHYLHIWLQVSLIYQMGSSVLTVDHLDLKLGSYYYRKGSY